MCESPATTTDPTDEPAPADLVQVWRERARGTAHPRVRNVFENAAKLVELALRDGSTMSLTDALTACQKFRLPDEGAGPDAAASVVVSELHDCLSRGDQSSTGSDYNDGDRNGT